MGRRGRILEWTSALALGLALLLCILPGYGQIPTEPRSEIPKEVQERAISATVRVRQPGSSQDGSGVVIGWGGPFVYILTARHVVENADRLEVAVFSRATFPAPKATYRSAEIVAESGPVADLALLRLATTDEMPSRLAVCPEKQIPSGPGLPVLAVGCDPGQPPSGLEEMVKMRKLTRRSLENEPGLFWETSREHPAGRSGGPLLDRRGYLIGICSGSRAAKTYFSHAEEIHKFLNKNGFRWLSGEEAGLPRR